jgi:hypothetical protein
MIEVSHVRDQHDTNRKFKLMFESGVQKLGTRQKRLSLSLMLSGNPSGQRAIALFY